MTRTEHWKAEPDEHDFPAAADYLRLLLPEDLVELLVQGLRDTPPVHLQAKDLLRASRLPLLPPTNVHVASDLKKVRKGQLLSPVLLVRGDLTTGVPLTIADGYHRVCASYQMDENADIPCRLADVDRHTTAISEPDGARTDA